MGLPSFDWGLPVDSSPSRRSALLRLRPFGQQHRALDRVLQLADVARPVVAHQELQRVGRRARRAASSARRRSGAGRSWRAPGCRPCARAAAACRSTRRSAGSTGPRGTARSPPSPAGRGWWRRSRGRRRGCVRVPPSRSNSCSCRTRRIFACVFALMSPTSSRKSVPPSACSKRPTRCLSAPVNAPFSWPKSSDSRRFSWSAAQFTFTKFRAARSELWWMAPAMSSLPVPVSPRMRTVVLLLATFLTMPSTAPQRAARADDAVELVDVLLRVAQVLDLVLEAAELDRLLDLELHLLDLEGLLHVVERADLHRLDGRVHRPERRHEDDRRRRVQRLRGAQHVHAVAAAHLEVAQDDVELSLVQLFDGDVAVGRLVDFVARVGQARARSRASANRDRPQREFDPYCLRSVVSHCEPAARARCP